MDGAGNPTGNNPWYTNSNVDARKNDGVIAETLVNSNRNPTYRPSLSC